MLKKRDIYSSTTVAEQDTDVNGAGKLAGFDELYTVQTGKTTGKGQVACAGKGGLLYGSLILTDNGERGHGTVTGGTWIFTGAAGTISYQPASTSGTRAAVTITYTT